MKRATCSTPTGTPTGPTCWSVACRPFSRRRPHEQARLDHTQGTRGMDRTDPTMATRTGPNAGAPMNRAAVLAELTPDHRQWLGTHASPSTWEATARDV